MKLMRTILFSLLFGIGIQVIYAVAPPKREMRGVWLTTVYGLDWPHRPATTLAGVEMQQRELCDLLDRLAAANFNSVFMQVRLRGDVLWRSAVEPMSKVCFEGKDNLPAYDPLAFAVDECHKRGMELHAWLVTFPLGTDEQVKSLGRRSVVKRHPELCRHHRGAWYLDPGVPGTTDYILSLVKELVTCYDIDGIHFDYMRYPEQADRFPDKTTYRKYGAKRPLAEWRRENINRMVARIYDRVKSEKAWVQVSSSPLGKYSRIERVPDAGWTAYESVSQDPQSWLAAGKQDMIVPMMYYLYDNFFPFMDNWVENSNNRLVVPGLGAYRLLEEEGDWELTDITDQIDYSRYYGGAGCLFFRCSQVLDNTKGLYDELKDNYYKYPAQLPPLAWLDSSVPPAPEALRVEREGAELKITWNSPDSAKVDLRYTLYYSLGDSIDTTSARNILMTGIRDTAVYLPVDTLREQGFLFSVSSSSRYHIESAPSPETYYYLSRYPK